MIRGVFHADHLHTYNAPRSSILPDTRPTDSIKNALTLPIQLYHNKGDEHWHPNNTRTELTDAIADGVASVR